MFAFISGGKGQVRTAARVFEASLCWLGRLTALQLWHWLSSTERERETADFIALHSVVDVIHVLVFFKLNACRAVTVVCKPQNSAVGFLHARANICHDCCTTIVCFCGSNKLQESLFSLNTANYV